MPYALFKDGVQISKKHSTIEAVIVEAFECKAYYKSGRGIFIDGRYKIKEVKE